MIHGKLAKTCKTTSLLLLMSFIFSPHTRQSRLPGTDRDDLGAVTSWGESDQQITVPESPRPLNGGFVLGPHLNNICLWSGWVEGAMGAGKENFFLLILTLCTSFNDDSHRPTGCSAALSRTYLVACYHMMVNTTICCMWHSLCNLLCGGGRGGGGRQGEVCFCWPPIGFSLIPALRGITFKLNCCVYGAYLRKVSSFLFFPFQWPALTIVLFISFFFLKLNITLYFLEWQWVRKWGVD